MVQATKTLRSRLDSSQEMIQCPRQPFRDLRSFSHSKDPHSTLGKDWVSKDGKRRVILTRSMWRNWETYQYVDIYINDKHFRLHGEDEYYAWKAALPLPGYKNGWW